MEGTGSACRENAKGRIKSMVERMRKQADGLEKLGEEIDDLSPEAEESLWTMACGRFWA